MPESDGSGNQMKIAYLLLVHEYPQNTSFLIQQLLREKECEIFVHVDRNVTIQPFFIQNSRVHYINSRFKVTWGGFSMIKATFALIGAARTVNPQYYCLLSGRDFLLKSPLEWKNVLSQIYPKSFLDGDTVVARWTERGLDRVHYHFFYMFKNRTLAYYQNRLVRRIGHILHWKRKMIDNLVPYCGSQWWTLSDRHIATVFHEMDRHPCFWDFYRTVGIPDEQFFQTLLYNSDQREELICRSQTYVVMKRGFVQNYNLQQLEELKNCGYFFARKIESDHLELQRALLLTEGE